MEPVILDDLYNLLYFISIGTIIGLQRTNSNFKHVYVLNNYYFDIK